VDAAAAKAGTEAYEVLKGNTVTVYDTVTKADMDALEELSSHNDYPKLKITAYACQLKKGSTPFTPYEAWTEVTSGTTSGTTP
jgi:hypothetical protein